MCRDLRFLPVGPLDEGVGDRPRRVLLAQAAQEGRVTAAGLPAHPLIHQGPQVLVQLVGPPSTAKERFGSGNFSAHTLPVPVVYSGVLTAGAAPSEHG